MHPTAAEIPPDVRATLARATYEENRIRLSPDDDHCPHYLEVRATLAHFGGRWLGGKTAAFVFPADVDTAAIVRPVVCADAVAPTHRHHSFFPTPPEVVRRMTMVADLAPPCRVLEPSAGEGALALAAAAVVGPERVTCVELDPGRCQVLRNHRFVTFQGDFLTFNLDGKLQFDRVLMHPPFVLDGAHPPYIAHVEHAFMMLAARGLLVAAVPSRDEIGDIRAARRFANAVERLGHFESLPDAAFRANGSNIRTALAVLKKPH